MAVNNLPPIPPNIALLTGPTIVGLCLNWGLLGVSAVQIYFYSSSFPNDRKGIKALVFGLALLDVLQTGMTTADSFYWFVYGFGNMKTLDTCFLNPFDMVMIDTIIGFIAQLFYCWRIYVLRKTLIIPGLISMVAITACGAGVATAVKSYQLGKISLISTLVTTQTIWMISTVIADIAIAVAISWTLLKATRNSMAATQGTVARIIWLIAETNALTAGVAVISFVIFLGFPHSPTLIVPLISVLGKLYFNCLMAVLNNRSSRAGQSSGSRGSSGNIPANRFRMAESGVKITRTQKVHVDPILELEDISSDMIHKSQPV
ncbi:hypothetical protein C8R44DRAFT_878349 [Mycena epipterygia]|nr:hypothetical protein C8R44DRAFT_878349 [Mycena epipterygia]